MIQHLLDTAQFIFLYYSSSLKYITYTYSICFLIYRFLSVHFIQIPVSIYLTDFFFFNPVTNSSLFGKVNCPTLPLNRLYFLGLQNHCGWWLQPWNKKTLTPWKKSYDHLDSRFGEGNGNPLQCSCLENPRDGGAWWAAIYEAAQSRTRLKWLNSNRAHFINIFFHSLFLLPYLKNFASFSVIFFSLCFSEKCNGLSYWFHRILKSKVLHSQRYHFTSTRWLKWKKWRIMHDSVVYC